MDYYCCTAECEEGFWIWNIAPLALMIGKEEILMRTASSLHHLLHLLPLPTLDLRIKFITHIINCSRTKWFAACICCGQSVWTIPTWDFLGFIPTIHRLDDDSRGSNSSDQNFTAVFICCYGSSSPTHMVSSSSFLGYLARPWKSCSRRPIQVSTSENWKVNCPAVTHLLSISCGIVLALWSSLIIMILSISHH